MLFSQPSPVQLRKEERDPPEACGYLCVQVCVSVCAWMCVCRLTCACLSTYVCMGICTSLYMRLHASLCAWTHICSAFGSTCTSLCLHLNVFPSPLAKLLGCQRYIISQQDLTGQTLPHSEGTYNFFQDVPGCLRPSKVYIMASEYRN